MMKICILMSILIFLGTSEGQTNETTTKGQTNETTTMGADYTGSGDVITDTPSNPCLSDPCKYGGACSISTSGDTFSCECQEGYSGERCETIDTCSEKEYSFYQNETRDGVDCGDDNATTSDNTMNTVTFTETSVGQWTVSSQTCTESCVAPGANQPLAIAECTETGEFRVSVTDCSNNGDTLSDEDRLLYAVAVTASPGEVTTSSVEFAVETTTNFTTDAVTISQEDADTVMTVYDNLLAPDAATMLTDEQSTEILDSIDDLSDKVILTTYARDASQSYQRIDNYVALAVASVDTEGAYFAADQDFTDGTSLTNTGLDLTNVLPTNNGGPYIEAKTDSGNARISFRVYTSYDSLFPNTAGLLLVQNTVLSAYGNANFRFSFSNTQQGTNPTCRRWSRLVNDWQPASQCEATTQTDSVVCACSEEGDYIVTTVAVNPDSGLSGGAIAGIVIGSIAAVALIGGGIYYFAFYAKKKKNSVNVSQDELQLKDVEENESDKTRGD